MVVRQFLVIEVATVLMDSYGRVLRDAHGHKPNVPVRLMRVDNYCETH